MCTRGIPAHECHACIHAVALTNDVRVAKFEELELHVPLIPQLKAAVGGCYTATAIAQTELQILFRCVCVCVCVCMHVWLYVLCRCVHAHTYAIKYISLICDICVYVQIKLESARVCTYPFP